MNGAAPDYGEAIVAWRVWRFGDGAAELAPLNRGRAWPAGRAYAAACLCPFRGPSGPALGRRHDAPQPGCSCGVYASRDEGVAREVLASTRHRWTWMAPVVAYVLGEVSLWGRVVEHEGGYRAELAYPRHVIVPRLYHGYVHEPGGRSITRLDPAEAAALLAAAYGIPAEVEAE